MVNHSDDSSSDDEIRDYLETRYSEPGSPPAKNSYQEFFEQLGNKIIMNAGGGLGDIQNTIRNAPSYSNGQMTQNDMGSPSISQQETPPPGSIAAARQSMSPRINLPTSEQIGHGIGYTEPTTPGGRIGARIGGNIGSALPFSLIGGPVAGAAMLGMSALGGLAGGAVKELGAPESVATGVDIGTSLMGGALSAFKNVLKSSGLKARNFENLSRTKKISPEKYESLIGEIGDESKTLADNIFSDNETFKAFRTDPEALDSALTQQLDRVAQLAEQHPETISGNAFLKFVDKRVRDRSSAPIMRTNSDKSYNSLASSKMRDIFNRQKGPAIVHGEGDVRAIQSATENAKNSVVNRAIADQAQLRKVRAESTITKEAKAETARQAEEKIGKERLAAIKEQRAQAELAQKSETKRKLLRQSNAETNFSEGMNVAEARLRAPMSKDNVAKKTKTIDVRSNELRKPGRISYDAPEILRQFRIGNSEAGKILNGTRSIGENEGKVDALLNINRGTADAFKHITKSNPELNQMFTTTNKVFSERAVIQKVDDFMDSVFSNGKINYKEASKYLSDKRFRGQIRNTIGKDRENAFSNLIKDVISQRRGLEKLRPRNIRSFAGLGDVYSAVKGEMATRPQINWAHMGRQNRGLMAGLLMKNSGSVDESSAMKRMLSEEE